MSTTSDLSNTVRAHAEDVGTQAKAAATQETVAQANKAKSAVANKAQQAANAADAAASELDPASPQAEAIRQVADHIEGVASQLRHADVRELATQATNLARRNPLLFVGGAAIAGFAAARFFKARDPQSAFVVDDDDPWAAPSDAQSHTAVGDVYGSREDA